MTKEIWKFELMVKNPHIKMPIGAKILSLQNQRQRPTLWVEVNSRHELEERVFMFVDTGEEFTFTNGKYIGTVLMDAASVVWHLYELV